MHMLKRLISGIQKRRFSEFVGYGLVAPYVIYSIIFWVYPFLWGLIIAFKKWNIIAPDKEFVGFDNFIRVIQDPLFWISFKNILFFMIVYIPLVIICSLSVALMLNRIKILRSFFASGYLMSYVSA